MLFSFVVTSYNLEKYIKRCIDSLMNQSGNDYEILVVDDCSTDRTLGLLREYKDIKLISLKENRGCSFARNIGIAEASGDYICIIDGDDYVTPLYLVELRKIIRDYSPDIIAINAILMIGGFPFSYAFHAQSGPLDYPFKVFEILVSPAQLFVVRRDLYQGVEFPVGKFFEDIFTLPKLIGKSSSLYLESTPLYCFQKNREGSITYEMTQDKRNDYIESLSYLLLEYKDNLSDKAENNIRTMITSTLKGFERKYGDSIKNYEKFMKNLFTKEFL